MKRFKILITGVLLTSSLIASTNYKKQGDIIEAIETGLIWEDTIASGVNKHSLNEARKYCQNLILDGKDDWRLPSYIELMSLSDYGKEGYEEARPQFNAIFENISSGYYWSLTKKNTFTGTNQIKYREEPLALYFSSVPTYENDRTGKASARCVREK